MWGGIWLCMYEADEYMCISPMQVHEEVDIRYLFFYSIASILFLRYALSQDLGLTASCLASRPLGCECLFSLIPDVIDAHSLYTWLLHGVWIHDMNSDPVFAQQLLYLYPRRPEVHVPFQELCSFMLNICSQSSVHTFWIIGRTCWNRSVTSLPLPQSNSVGLE